MTWFCKINTNLNLGGSMGSLWASTILIILCLAPELKATPCCDGVYLGKRIISFLHMELEICHECNIKTQNISKSINYIFYVYFQNIYFQIIAYTSSSFLITQKICFSWLLPNILGWGLLFSCPDRQSCWYLSGDQFF